MAVPKKKNRKVKKHYSVLKLKLNFNLKKKSFFCNFCQKGIVFKKLNKIYSIFSFFKHRTVYNQKICDGCKQWLHWESQKISLNERKKNNKKKIEEMDIPINNKKKENYANF